MTAPATETSHLRTLQKIEATIGAFFAFLVGFVVVVIGGDMVYLATVNEHVYILFPIWLILVLLEGAFLWKLKNALETAEYPFAPRFVLKLRQWPFLLRPLVSLWWLAHFSIGIIASIFFDNLIIADVTTWNVRLVRCLIFIIVDLTIAYSANLYALLALRALGVRDTTIYKVWRWRILLDLTIAIIAAFFPLFIRRY